MAGRIPPLSSELRPQLTARPTHQEEPAPRNVHAQVSAPPRGATSGQTHLGATTGPVFLLPFVPPPLYLDGMFGLLNVVMLAGLAVVAVPPVIHLLNRRRYDVVDWGAM